MGKQKQVIVKTYKGSQAAATAAYQKDAIKMAAQGYAPTSQSWAPGTYGCATFLVALLLFVVAIGVLIFIYMLIVKPPGALSVTYELRAFAGGSVDQKTCPKCAEQVKQAALVCRFCSHEFVAGS